MKFLHFHAAVLNRVRILAVAFLVGMQVNLQAQNPGDLAVVGVSTSEMLYLTLGYIPAGTTLHITEKSWNGIAWVAGPDAPGTGNISITAGNSGIPVGSYILIQNLATTPTVASGTGYFSDVTVSNSSAFSFDFQGNKASTATILKVHYATTATADPTGKYIWVIALGNYAVLGSTYGIPENCAVDRANNGNITSTSLSSSLSTMDKESALNFIDNGSSWGSGTVPSSVSVPIISAIDLANTTWTGAWDNGVPNNSMDAIIASDFTSSTDGALEVGGNLTVNDGAVLTVDGTVNNRLAVYGDINLSTTGSVVLRGGAGGFATIPSSTTFSGSGTIKYEITITQAGWHHISAPGSVLLSDIIFSSMSLSYSGNTANIYKWDAASASWVTASSSDDLGASAYAVYIPGSEVITVPFTATTLNNVTTASYNLSYYDPAGNPPGNSASGWSTSVEDGWNMIGNPFPEYLNWDMLDNSASNFVNMDLSVYVWNPTLGAYVSYSSIVGGSFGISPFQAFFVRATTTGATLTESSAVRSSTGLSYFTKNSNDGVERFSLVASTSRGSAQNVFAFVNNGTLDKDIYDSYAFEPANGSPFMYSTTRDSVRVCHQSLPLGNRYMQTYLTVYTDLDGEQVTLSFDDQGLGVNREVILSDLLLGTSVVLSETGSYSFVTDANMPAQRFLLTVCDAGTVMHVEEDEMTSAYVYASEAGYQLVIPNDYSGVVEYRIYDLSGRLQDRGTVVVSEGRATVNFEKSTSGMYILQLSLKNEVVSLVLEG